MAKLLLEYNASVAGGDNSNCPYPLHLAVRNGDVVMTQFLLDYVAKVNSKTFALRNSVDENPRVQVQAHVARFGSFHTNRTCQHGSRICNTVICDLRANKNKSRTQGLPMSSLATKQPSTWPWKEATRPWSAYYFDVAPIRTKGGRLHVERAFRYFAYNVVG